MFIEVTTEAIVLDKEDLGEQDSRVFLYTGDLGKIVAKATSARKITSKLNAHLEPFNYATVRLISKGDFIDGRGFQVADALLIDDSRALKSDPQALSQSIRAVELIRKSIPEGVPDRELWNFIESIRKKEITATPAESLKILGFDSGFAACELCGKTQPEYFFPKSNFFTCNLCRVNSKEEKREFIEIKRY